MRVAVVTGATVLTLGAAYYYKKYYDDKGNTVSKSNAQKDTVTVAALPALSAEKTALVFETIVAEMGGVMMQLAKIEAQVRQESASTGQPIPEDQLMAYLGQNFEASLQKVSQNVYQHLAVSEEDAEYASNYYKKDARVGNAVNQLMQLIHVATGQAIETEADGTPNVEISIETMLEMLEETFSIMGDVMETTCAEIIAEEIPKDKIGETLQMRYTQKADTASATVFSKFDVTRASFQNATIKYSTNATFIAKMQSLQTQQDIRFQKAAEGLNLE